MESWARHHNLAINTRRHLWVTGRGVQGPVRQCGHGFFNGRFRVAGEEQHVVSSEDGVSDARAVAHEVGKALHAHGVREHQPFESHFVAQQAVDDERGQGGGLGFGAVEARDVQVGHHDGPHAVVKGVGERREFDGVQSRARMADGGKRFVRIAVAVAVSWKVFGRRQNMHVLQAVGVRLAQPRHPWHRLPKTPTPNHRVERIGIHIDDRGEIDMHPRGAEALADHLPKQPDQFRVARRTQRHGPGERARAVQTHAQAPFGVRGHHERHASFLLQTLQARALMLWSALHADDATQPEVAGPSFRLRPTRGVSPRIDGHHEELGNLFFHGQGAQDAVDEEAVGAQKCRLNGAGGLEGVLGAVAAGQGKQGQEGVEHATHQASSSMRVRANDTRKLNCSSTVKSLLSTTTASSA